MYNCLCHSVHCSRMLRNVKLWSVHPRYFLKPACSCLMPASTESEIRLKMILAWILLGTDSSVMPLQLLQSLSAPLCGILMLTPFIQSAGTSPPSHRAAKSGCKMVAASSWSCLEELCVEVVMSWNFTILQGLNCLDYLFFLWDSCVDVKVGSSFRNASIFFRWWSV